MARLLKFLLLPFAFCLGSHAAVGFWNGVAFTAWNGIAITSWNGTTISSAGCSALTANTAGFTGSDHGRRTGAITGVADGKVFTCSLWVDMTAGDGALKMFFCQGGTGHPGVQVYRISSNKIEIAGYNSAGTVILDAVTTATIVAADGWKHIYVTVDLANSSNRHVYINGSEDSTTWATYTNDTLDLDQASPSWNIGRNYNDLYVLSSGYMAELWFDDVYLNSPSLFRCSTHPVSLGTTGEIPTGSAPALYLSLSGSGNSWATDSSGNGNTFTVTGTLGSTTSP